MTRLDQLERLIKSQGINTKEILNFGEACLYLEVSSSHLYKLTSGGVIPFYKPNGKKIYFKREDLNTWLLTNKHRSNAEIEKQAQNFQAKKGRANHE